MSTGLARIWQRLAGADPILRAMRWAMLLPTRMLRLAPRLVRLQLMCTGRLARFCQIVGDAASYWSHRVRTSVDRGHRAVGGVGRTIGQWAGACVRHLVRIAGHALQSYDRIRRVELTRHQQVATLVILFILLISATFGVIGIYTKRVLFAEAESVARKWERFVRDSVPDLESVLSGAVPATQAMATLRRASGVGNVYQIKLYDRDGRLIAASNATAAGSTARSSLDEEHDGLRERLIGRGGMALGRRGVAPGEPSHVAEAYLPIRESGAPIGFIGVYVDQTGSLSQISTMMAELVLSLGVILSLMFGIPGAALWLSTRQKDHAEARLRFLAHHDPLTGLPNRAAFQAELSAVCASARTDGRNIALHYIDLDRFKSVNDTLGHDAGDQLLREVALRLRRVMGPSDIAARLGGDEFVVVETSPKSDMPGADLGPRLVNALSEPVDVKGHKFIITPSIGTALSPAHAASVEDLVKAADLAMYFAKSQGRACHRLFDATMSQSLERRRQLEALLRSACDAGDFELHYQPIFRMRGRQLIGFEALIRLAAPDGTPISPAEFIPIAEELGLSPTISRWVLEEACRTAARWPHELKVAVNLSAADFPGGGVSSAVRDALAASGLEPHRLELEVTEGVLLQDQESTRRQLTELHDLGVAIVLDDFGTGYSSLAYLWQFQFDKIKIDQSFVRALGFNASVPGIVRTIITLGRLLNMRITAEGVETIEQAAVLEAMLCENVQGYLYGRPQPASALPALIMGELADGLSNGLVATSRHAAAREEAGAA